jgi:alanyl-tRNA synthetase
MNSNEVRKSFLDFFEKKGHKIVPSAPIVVKNDPTLLFINSGMAPFKDFFLENATPPAKRIADTQKCLRVSGKHNDLEEVGVDTYHHTMFEMLGNWSFGDYFKKEAIEWAWEFLTEVCKLDKDRLYVTVFEGDEKEKLAFDQEAYDEWKKWIAEARILKGNKKDNFWEMGDTGPCGPCTEIHVDLRSDEERKNIAGDSLVNNDHPQVIEIWNNVFMQFERKADGSLIPLPNKHVDTGMGFERLVRAVQGFESNYDTDIFQDYIQYIAKKANLDSSLHTAKGDSTQAIALRVVADHIRTIAFTIADGQLPSNTGAGYVIRRILRRAVRYGYSALAFDQPFIHELVPLVADKFATIFPELKAQEAFVAKVIFEEEAAFLRTLSQGLKRFEIIESELNDSKIISGKVAFELFDTFGFPIDLTKLIAAEKGLKVDEIEFEKELQIQKERSRKAATTEQSDWVSIHEGNNSQFVGYDQSKSESLLLKYRTVKIKDTERFQLVLNQTPFYAESGGQVGDTGQLFFASEAIEVIDTKKENDLIIHFTKKLPNDLKAKVTAKINSPKRAAIIRNHSATHLLQAAMRQVLGDHVQQKGSLVNADYLRFDFAHFAKVTDEEIAKIETIVNQKILENISLLEQRNVPIAEAEKSGATMLFGEKYGDNVRIITFDKNFSSELCGGCHVPATGAIGLFKISAESAVAAGVRRIEALTGKGALDFLNEKATTLDSIKSLLNSPKDIEKSILTLQEENNALKKKIEEVAHQELLILKDKLVQEVTNENGVNCLIKNIEIASNDQLKNLVYLLKNEQTNFVFALAATIQGKATVHIMIDESLSKQKNWSAGAWIKELSPLIKGGGGGQPFYASAGGTEPNGIANLLQKIKEKIAG